MNDTRPSPQSSGTGHDPTRPAGSAPVRVGVLALLRAGPEGLTVLVTRRRADQVLGGLWEFPGGKARDRESAADAARREVAEEVGVVVSAALTPLATVRHRYPHGEVFLEAYLAAFPEGQTPQCLDVDEWRFVRVAELADLAFPDANAPIVAELGARLERGKAAWSHDSGVERSDLPAA